MRDGEVRAGGEQQEGSAGGSSLLCERRGVETEMVDAGKRDFRCMIDRDIEDLDQFDVPPAPVHLSNSTDPFQPLEDETGHARYALEQLLAHRNRFTTVVFHCNWIVGYRRLSFTWASVGVNGR